MPPFAAQFVQCLQPAQHCRLLADADEVTAQPGGMGLVAVLAPLRSIGFAISLSRRKGAVNRQVTYTSMAYLPLSYGLRLPVGPQPAGVPCQRHADARAVMPADRPHHRAGARWISFGKQN